MTARSWLIGGRADEMAADDSTRDGAGRRGRLADGMTGQADGDGLDETYRRNGPTAQNDERTTGTD